MGHRRSVRRSNPLAASTAVLVVVTAVLGLGLGGDRHEGHEHPTGLLPHAHGADVDEHGGHGHPRASLPCGTVTCIAATIVDAEAVPRREVGSWELGSEGIDEFGEAAIGPEPPVPRPLRFS